MASLAVLTCNIGSSSLKASLFATDGRREDFNCVLSQASETAIVEAFEQLLIRVKNFMPTVIGHRLVHGGDVSQAASLIDADERRRLNGIVALAPLHLPNSLKMIDLCANAFPDVPQVACFDNAFHATLPEISYRLPIPQSFKLRRYGFHGLSFSNIAKQLPELIGEDAQKRMIIAHLGSGASLCLLENLKSVDTTMGYSPAGGIPMATRSGDLDPGVMLALADKLSTEALYQLTYQQMGLIALSEGISSDVRTLLATQDARAKFALDYYARQIRAAIGALVAKWGGVDALVFTGGVGEHASEIRAAICERLAFMGLQLSPAANQSNATFVHAQNSKPILVLPCDEAAEMAELCKATVRSLH